MAARPTREPPAIEVEEPGPRTALLPSAPSGPTERLRHVHRRATRMRPQEWLEQDDAAVLHGTVATPLLELLEEASTLLRALIDQTSTPVNDDTNAAFDALWGEEPSEPSAQTPASRSPRSHVPELGDIAFAAQLELTEAAHRLRREGFVPDALRIAVESERARRKLRRCIEAVVCAAPAVPPPSLPPGIAGDAIQQAIVVRTAYTRFRRSIPSCDTDDPSSLFAALRTAANAVSKLLGGPAFEFVRHSDRVMLRGLQDRIVTWARAPDHAEGVRLHHDFVTTADLLRDINKRQELQAHDDMTMASLRGRLEMGVTACEARAEARHQLESLLGRDDDLDAIIVRLRAGWDEDTAEELVGLLDRLVPSTKVFSFDS